MGCIVNGPGEMADADFGYVRRRARQDQSYVGKQPIKFNIPEAKRGPPGGPHPRTRQVG